MRRLFLLPILALAACSEPESTGGDVVAPVPPADAPTETAAPQAETSTLPELEQVWVAAGFSSPEGVASEGDILFISNVAGEGGDKDGEGWISRLTLEGAVLEEKWVEGFNAPKGLAIRDGKLFCFRL